mmetsp:Transcript_4214/g.18788  ORF Transcript_4214/g.18788 Transcript_4214/m.18788 type:complete len:311 (-) Transcript_4214:339-1271(-)
MDALVVTYTPRLAKGKKYTDEIQSRHHNTVARSRSAPFASPPRARCIDEPHDARHHEHPQRRPRHRVAEPVSVREDPAAGGGEDAEKPSRRSSLATHGRLFEFATRRPLDSATSDRPPRRIEHHEQPQSSRHRTPEGVPAGEAERRRVRQGPRSMEKRLEESFHEGRSEDTAGERRGDAPNDVVLEVAGSHPVVVVVVPPTGRRRQADGGRDAQQEERRLRERIRDEVREDVLPDLERRRREHEVVDVRVDERGEDPSARCLVRRQDGELGERGERDGRAPDVERRGRLRGGGGGDGGGGGFGSAERPRR